VILCTKISLPLHFSSDFDSPRRAKTSRFRNGSRKGLGAETEREERASERERTRKKESESMFVARLCALRQHGARVPSARLLFNCANPWKRSTEGGVALEAPSVPEREGAPPPASSGAGEGRPFSSVSSLDRDCTYDVGSSSNIKWHESPVTRDAREKQLNQRGCVLWMTGLSGSGKVRSAAPRRVPSSHVASPRLTPLLSLLPSPFLIH